MEVEKGFGITPEAVEAARKQSGLEEIVEGFWVVRVSGASGGGGL